MHLLSLQMQPATAPELLFVFAGPQNWPNTAFIMVSYHVKLLPPQKSTTSYFSIFLLCLSPQPLPAKSPWIIFSIPFKVLSWRQGASSSSEETQRPSLFPVPSQQPSALFSLAEHCSCAHHVCRLLHLYALFTHIHTCMCVCKSIQTCSQDPILPSAGVCAQAHLQPGCGDIIPAGDRYLQLLHLRLINIIKIPTNVFLPCLFLVSIAISLSVLCLCTNFLPMLHGSAFPLTQPSSSPYPDTNMHPCPLPWFLPDCWAEVEERGSALQNSLHPCGNHCKGCHGESKIRSPNVLKWEGRCSEGDFASMLGLNEGCS